MLKSTKDALYVTNIMTLGNTFLNPSDKRINVAPRTPSRMQEASKTTALMVIGGGTPVALAACARHAVRARAKKSAKTPKR